LWSSLFEDWRRRDAAIHHGRRSGRPCGRGLGARLSREADSFHRAFPALKAGDVRERLAAEGGDALGGTPEQFASLLKADLARWGQIVKQSGAKVD
jgi:hypothetical protein